MSSIPSAPSACSSASKYSCVAPGPPCSSSSRIRGLCPKRLVQTLNWPLGVRIGMSRTPAASTPASGEKYERSETSAGVGVGGGVVRSIEQAASSASSTTADRARTRLMGALGPLPLRGHSRELVVQVHRRAHRLHEVAQVEALVLR